VSEKLTSEDPCDGINVHDLEGWIRRDSDGMREASNEQRLGRNQGSGDQNPWVSLAND